MIVLPDAKNHSDWRRKLLLRDCSVLAVINGKEVRRGRCVLCYGEFDIPSLQAHHIFPKAVYPALSLVLDNGVMLCAGCHIGTVHRGNPAMDISTWHRWEDFVNFFERHVERCYELNADRNLFVPRRNLS